MGLDNGIIIKGKTINGKRYLENNFSHLDRDSNGYNFAYWRKCWNIRHAFIDAFKDKYNENTQEIVFNIPDLWDVRTILKDFLIEENWEENESIWSWENIILHISEVIRDITYFINDVTAENSRLGEEDFEIYFYDSY